MLLVQPGTLIECDEELRVVVVLLPGVRLCMEKKKIFMSRFCYDFSAEFHKSGSAPAERHSIERSLYEIRPDERLGEG